MKSTEEVVLSNGNKLTIRPVVRSILQSLVAKLVEVAGPEVFDNPTVFENLPKAKMSQALVAWNKMAKYCAGWGVVEKPPNSHEELFEILGLEGTVHIKRAHWVLHIVTEGNMADQAKIIGSIMALSFEEIAAETAAEDEIVELRKRVAELEN